MRNFPGPEHIIAQCFWTCNRCFIFSQHYFPSSFLASLHPVRVSRVSSLEQASLFTCIFINNYIMCVSQHPCNCSHLMCLSHSWFSCIMFRCLCFFLFKSTCSFSLSEILIQIRLTFTEVGAYDVQSMRLSFFLPHPLTAHSLCLSISFFTAAITAIFSLLNSYS